MFAFALALTIIVQAAGGSHLLEHPDDPGGSATCSWESFMWRWAAKQLKGAWACFDACALGGLARNPTATHSDLITMMVLNGRRCTCTFHMKIERTKDLARWPRDPKETSLAMSTQEWTTPPMGSSCRPVPPATLSQ